MRAWEKRWLETYDGLEGPESEPTGPPAFPEKAANEPMALPLPPGCPTCPKVAIVWEAEPRNPEAPEVNDHADDERRAAYGK